MLEGSNSRVYPGKTGRTKTPAMAGVFHCFFEINHKSD